MPKLNEILSPSFKDFHHTSDHHPMIQVAYDSDLCQEVIAKGWLSEAQMRHAAERYRLGRSRSGKCIYWMIDEMMQVRDGHLGDAWVSQLLKAREPELLRWFLPRHCLFGLHLLNHGDCPNDSSAAKIRGTVPCDSAGFAEAEEQDLPF